MDMNDTSSDNQNPPVTKKPYEKPAFRYERVFVTSALTCGKIDPTSMTCHNNANAS
jgi:hypothetical protein